MLRVDLLPVQAVRGDRQDPVYSLGVGEGDEAEASVPLREWILHEIYVGDVAELPEILLKFFHSGLPR